MEPGYRSTTVIALTRPRPNTLWHPSLQEVDDGLYEAPESYLIAWMHIITSDNAAGGSRLTDISYAKGVLMRSQRQ